MGVVTYEQDLKVKEQSARRPQTRRSRSGQQVQRPGSRSGPHHGREAPAGLSEARRALRETQPEVDGAGHASL